MFNALLQLGAKVLVTGGLGLLILFCSAEIWKLWFDTTLVIAPFEYIKDGALAPERGEEFVRLVRADLLRLGKIYRTEARNPVIASTDQVGRAEKLPLPEIRDLTFPSVEIQAYGLQLSSILKSLNRTIVSPNEIRGRVTENSGTFSVDAEIRASPQLLVNTEEPDWGNLPAVSTVSDAASGWRAEFSEP